MRIVRFSIHDDIKFGIMEGNAIRSLQESPFLCFKGYGSSFTFDGNTYNPEEVRLVAPSVPSKIVGVGLNYRSHAEETKFDIPAIPLIFLKPSTAVIGPDDDIILPPLSKRVDYEGELAVVIGRTAKSVTQDEAKGYVLGYTCINDVSERYAQKEDIQWTRAKGFDTFAPIGPWIETEVDPDDLKLETYLNGNLRQSAGTSDLIFGVAMLISFISGVMTLLPGDIIATGTPSGIGRLTAGDVVEIKIERIGTLRNFVAGTK